MLAGRAETVAVREDCRVFHSARMQIDVPSIVRLTHMVRIPRWARTPPVTRRSVLRRDGDLCVYCSQPADTIDHVIPAQPRRHARVDQRGGRLQAGQSREGRPTPLRTGVDDAGEAGAAGRASLAASAPLGRGSAVGAVSGCGFLTRFASSRRVGASSPFFDVERFRSEPRPAGRRPGGRAADARPRQHATSGRRVGRGRRRSGCRGRAAAGWRGSGAAPTGRPSLARRLDPARRSLWLMDVAVAAEWVGSWWSAALGEVGCRRAAVHAGKSEPGPLGDLVCFAGRGPGEVFAGERKLVGLSQWRAREGALFSSCVYTRWDAGSPGGVAGGR